MASTPSASALSAVLRCRGNIWPRNPPTKRPATSAYSLGLTGGSPAEHTRSNQASAWEAFLQGDRVLVGRRLTVAYKSPRVDGEMLRGKDSREMNKLAVLWRSSSSPDDDDDNNNDNALQHQNIRNNTLQANGGTRSPTDLSSSMDYSGSGQMTPEDRPD